jgi:hypothetical protein
MNTPSEFYTGTVSELLNHDVPLVPRLEKRAEQLIEDDPLAVDERHEHNDGGGNNVGSFKEMSRFHPFMRLFNVCARSMYLDEPKSRRMRLFSLRHPSFPQKLLDWRFYLHVPLFDSYHSCIDIYPGKAIRILFPMGCLSFELCSMAACSTEKDTPESTTRPREQAGCMIERAYRCLYGDAGEGADPR